MTPTIVSSVPPRTDAPPNILWIVLDELRPDALCCFGGQVADTPHIDALASRGVRFDRAYCQSPVCVPSRASFMTGKYPRTVEVYNNSMGLNIGSWHRARLREAITAMGPDAWDDWTETTRRQFRRQLEPYAGPVGDFFEDVMVRILASRKLVFELGLDEQGPRHQMFPEILARRGYRTVNLGKLHHQAPTDGFDENPIIEGAATMTGWGWRQDIAGDLDRIVRHGEGRLGIGLAVGGISPMPAEETPEALVTDAAIRVLENPGENPFLLRCSYVWPHTPVLPPEPYDRKFAPEDCRVVDFAPGEYERMPPSQRRRSDVSEDATARARADYFGLVSYMDAEIGRLTSALRRLGLEENTLVVLHSDHGQLMGEHGLWQKGSYYDPVVRVPLILSLPGRLPEGKVVDAPVELVDVAPTLLSQTATPVPCDMDGVDLTPTMNGRTDRPHDYAFSEIAQVDLGQAIPPEPRKIRRFVCDGEWRLDIFMGGEDSSLGGSLYNLIDDPEERSNLFTDPRVQRKVDELTDALGRWVRTTPTSPPIGQAASSPRGDVKPIPRRWM